MMAASAAEDVHRGEGWDQDEHSEMMSLLQRAEQRMRKLEPTSKYQVKPKHSDKYVMAGYFSTTRV